MTTGEEIEMECPKCKSLSQVDYCYNFDLWCKDDCSEDTDDLLPIGVLYPDPGRIDFFNKTMPTDLSKNAAALETVTRGLEYLKDPLHVLDIIVKLVYNEDDNPTLYTNSGVVNYNSCN